MLKDKLYAIMQLSEKDIAKGEARFAAFDKGSLAEFLDNIFSDVNDIGIHIIFPADLKALIINCIAHGTQATRKKVARALLYKLQYSNKLEQEGLFDLAWCWISNTRNKEIREILGQLMLYYVHDERAWQLYQEYIADTYPDIVQSIFYQPIALWSLFRNKVRYKEMWRYQQEYFPEQAQKIYRLWQHNIEARLNEQVPAGCLSLHRVENPWQYSEKVIDKLRDKGVDIVLKGETGDVIHAANGELLYHDLQLNGRLLGKAIGGPFVTNPQHTLLFCHILDEYNGLALSVINLKTNQFFRLDVSGIKLLPYNHDGLQLNAWLYDGTTILQERDERTFYVPEQIWGMQNQLRILDQNNGWGFDFDTHYIKSFISKYRYAFRDFVHHYIVGEFRIPQSPAVHICISVKTGEMDAFYYDQDKQQFFLMRINASLGEFIKALTVYQTFMREKGFSSEAYDAAITQLSNQQAQELKEQLEHAGMGDHTQHQFWRWLFEPLMMQAASNPRPENGKDKSDDS
ncbi:hypothetical protein [Microbulbifer halophilus]|uniref:DUF4132 domain-containing protein n=1 Tax=Microbulbifer halophilus TaxID=453963 RepID=A0ABW5EFY6_9GAMM|nr:hypothetical protein [Microbulbifer halophilus]MCW8128667.1 hypothetical protein [Microbulbifer halophilus]